MSGDTDKAKISDNQDEDKKSAGDGQSTEDESSQDSKGESLKTEVQGNDVVLQNDATDPPEGPPDTGDLKSKTANGKGDAADDSKDDSKDDIKEDGDAKKKEENGETHDDDDDEKDDEEEEVKEKNSKPAKKQPVKKKPKKEDTEEEDEEEEEEEEDEEAEGEEEDEEEDKPKEKAAKKPAKKPVKKAKDEDGEEDEEEGDEEGEEEEEEEEEEEAPKPKPKKEPTEPPVPVPAGKGIPLGHIGNVEISLSRFKTQDQKILHQYLYGQLCLDRNVKRNIKKFKGYEWTIGSSDYKAKLEETTKMEPKQLRTMCEMLDLDKKGSPSELSGRLVGFLQQPGPNSPHARSNARAAPAPAATPGGRPRRSAAVKVQHRGYSDEEYESDPSTKVKGVSKPVGDGSGDSDGSFNPSGSEEGDSDFDPEAGEGAPGPGRKKKVRRSSKPGKRGRRSGGKPGKGKGGKKAAGGRGRRAKSESEDESEKSESESEDRSGSDGEDSDEPKAKRGRPQAVVNKGGRKAMATKNIKATPAKRKAPEPAGKKKAAGKPGRPPAKRARKDESEEESAEEDASEDEDGSDDDDNADKPKRPPTDEEIRKYVKQILEGANLEEITMKTVCKQVYSHYPDFDLAHKKDFIKATVKSCI